MNILGRTSLMAAVALCAFPVMVPAAEAPAGGAATQDDTEKKLAAASQRLDEAAREVAALSSELGQRFNMRFGSAPEGGPPRALLGVSIGTNAQKDGAHVLDVSPGGPAAEAGIKSGDIITGIANLDLTKDSNPGRALVERMRQLEPDQKVKVALLRDGKKLSFDVAPRAAPPGMRMRRAELSDLGDLGSLGELGNLGNLGNLDLGNLGELGNLHQGRPPGPPVPPGARGPMLRERIMEMRRGDESESRFGGAEVASLSERLGSYFGVKSGVLVVRAGVNSPLKLQDGDVILAIDGREATSAQQAGRILRSYQPGEKLTLRVQRDRKVQNLEGAAPGGHRDD